MIEVRPGTPVLLPGIDSSEPVRIDPTSERVPTKPASSVVHEDPPKVQETVTEAMAARIGAYRNRHPRETGGLSDSDVMWMIHEEDVANDIEERNPYH